MKILSWNHGVAVFFRAETRKSAGLYNLKGWVRNLPDGRVEAVFEGAEEDIAKMIQWCNEGPPYAVIKKVEVKEEDFKGEFDEFCISF